MRYIPELCFQDRFSPALTGLKAFDRFLLSRAGKSLAGIPQDKASGPVYIQPNPAGGLFQDFELIKMNGNFRLRDIEEPQKFPIHVELCLTGPDSRPSSIPPGH